MLLVGCVNTPSRTELVPPPPPLPQHVSPTGTSLWTRLVVALAQPYDRPYRIGVTSVRFLRSTDVRKEPRLDAAKVGAVRGGTRSVPLRAQQGDRDCVRWIEIAPRGWVCEDVLEPTDQPPSTPQPLALDSTGGDDARSLVP